MKKQPCLRRPNRKNKEQSMQYKAAMGVPLRHVTIPENNIGAVRKVERKTHGCSERSETFKGRTITEASSSNVLAQWLQFQN